MPDALRYAAFTTDPAGGNPAGVVLDASGMSEAEMQSVAAEIGYSETVFIDPQPDGEYRVRYFSPLIEVAFCGHATIAGGVALAEAGASGRVVFNTQAGPVTVDTGTDDSGNATATLTSVPPRVDPIDDADLAEALAALGWTRDELDPALPPRVGYSGALYPVIAAATRERLSALDYDFDRLAAVMRKNDWITLQLVYRENELLFHSRNPFPVGGVVEDPATGAAAVALGAYLRELELVTPPATVTIRQGEDLGRPALLIVDIPAGDGGIAVTGTAVAMAG